MIALLSRGLRRNIRGTAATEFALVAPPLVLLLLGAFDAAHTLYMRAAIQGIVQKTARDSALETGTDAQQQSALDAKVTTSIRAIANTATVTFKRRFYRTFSDAAAAQAEAFTDTNSNGRCDAGELYQDQNSNSTWDADGGDGGQGTAKDRTLYTVVATYPRMFPVGKLISGSNVTRVTATTVLENQPYGDQASYGAVVVRNCP